MKVNIVLFAAASGLPNLVAGRNIFRPGNWKFHKTNSVDAPTTTVIEKRAEDTYTQYTGNAASGWPSTSEWVPDLGQMFDANKGILIQSCTQWNVPNNSEQEIEDLKKGIETVAAETKMDARFIFAVLMQESNGCVRAPTTDNGVRNPGLMQDHNGQATCNEKGDVKNPCPLETITQMIRDGVAGTPAGDGLMQTFAQAPGSEDCQKYYGAARMYNSGSIDPSGDLGAGVATHCYASDIANRLTGWVFAQKACTLDGAPAPAPAGNSPVSYPAGQPAQSEAPKPTEQPTPPAQSQPAPSPTTLSSVVSQPAPVETPPAASEPAPPAPQSTAVTGPVSAPNKAPGVTANCAQYYTIQAGDYCFAIAEKFGTTFEALRAMNTELDAGCSNLWLGYDYCVKSA